MTSTGKVRNVGLTGVNVTGGRRTGALAGTNSGAISGSSAEGTVSGNSFGGLVGKNDAGATITASYANVAVSGVGGVSGPGGGLVGENSGTIRASYATGAVSGHQRIGGLVGSQSSTSVIKASYATGVVSGTGTPLGGLVGSGSNGTVTNSYWNTDTSGQTSSAGGTGKTTSELQTPTAYGTSPSIYANWNLDLDGMAGDDDPWDFGGSADYPALDYGSLSPWASQWKLLLTATAGGRRVTLNWPPGAYGDRPAAIAQWQYRQKEGANAYGAWQSATGSGPNTARHVVTGLTGGTLYAFQVRAANAGGEAVGPESAEASATPSTLGPPARPSGLTATPGPGKATLSWAAGTDGGGVAIDRWEYRQRAGSGNYGSWVQISTDPATVQHEVGSLTPGTLYTFQVRALNARGDGQSATASATPTVVPPAQPTGLTATAGAGQVTLMWAAGTNSGSAPIDRWQYRQKEGTSAYGGWMQISTAPATTQHLVTSLLASTLYTFQVRAGNTGGAAFGPESAEVSATPTLGPPAQPTGLTATPGNALVTLRWDAGTVHGGAPINLWQYRQKEGAGAYGSWTQISTTPTTTEHGLTATPDNRQVTRCPA